MTMRCDWVLDNPDIVVTLHAIRVEIIVRTVMAHIVPEDDIQRFLYWLRFEFGTNGNPHAHGVAFVPRNPDFDCLAPVSYTHLTLPTICSV